MKAAIKLDFTEPPRSGESHGNKAPTQVSARLKKPGSRLTSQLVLVIKTDEPTRLLDTDEMAKLIAVSPETLTAWRKQNLVPHLKIRHVIRFDAKRVLAALEKLETKVAR